MKFNMEFTFKWNVSISVDGITHDSLGFPKTLWDLTQLVVGAVGIGFTCYQIFFSG